MALHKQSPANPDGGIRGPDALPGQVVLVMQGGGAVGAFQVGVYEALQESGIEPDWVIGTSIGAINGAIIAGNPATERLGRLDEFWHRMEYHSRVFPGIDATAAKLAAITHGIPDFFVPKPSSWESLNNPVGVDEASYYATDPLRETLQSLVDFDSYLKTRHPRLTVAAANARTGEMRYFDSRDEELGIEHVMASGALPPAFPAVRIAGEPYWDGGIYSNTPIEAVLDDHPRRDSVIFSVQLWNPNGREPETLWQVIGKLKEIQFASRINNIERQRQLHHLRHVIRELNKHLPEEKRHSPECKALAEWGCATVMHIIILTAPPIADEDFTKDIDFTSNSIRSRRRAGYVQTMRMIAGKPWAVKIDPAEGIRIYEAA
jgi:NTE family protein